MFRRLLVPVVALVACKNSAPPVESAPSASVAPPVASASVRPATDASKGPAWLDAATRAPEPLATRATNEHARGSPFRHDDVIDPMLDRVAAQEPTAAGIQAAAKILKDNAGAGGDPKWSGSGNSPAGALIHAAGVALLADLVARACAKNPKDAAIGRAVETIATPPWYTSVVDHAQEERDRDALREAGAACGLKPKRVVRNLSE